MQYTSTRLSVVKEEFDAVRINFGLPRKGLPLALRDKIIEQLYIGSDACRVGYLDRYGHFAELDSDADFDGPDFALYLDYAISGRQLFKHVVKLKVGILFGHFTLNVYGQKFELRFLPSMDESQLTLVARWIIRNIEKASRLA
ncbi:hypothetical protein PQR62_23810 [Herbaspirillum lusitanum]|uniref:Uncharacterized protein n=1 Tax=Herbaspirillum lusitanum TaxID=213312 RepID=A0ABW9AHK5_9BURK